MRLWINYWLTVSFEIPGSVHISVAKPTAGLHFLPAAYRMMYESMMELIRKEWPDQDPETEPFVLPAWTDISK